MLKIVQKQSYYWGYSLLLFEVFTLWCSNTCLTWSFPYRILHIPSHSWIPSYIVLICHILLRPDIPSCKLFSVGYYYYDCKSHWRGQTPNNLFYPLLLGDFCKLHINGAVFPRWSLLTSIYKRFVHVCDWPFTIWRFLTKWRFLDCNCCACRTTANIC